MPLGTHNRRPTPPPPFRSRDQYLRSKNPDDPRICHVTTGRPAQPWITPVIGSGCATSQSQIDALHATVVALEASVSARYPHQDIDGTPLGEVVKAFATDLIRDRLRLRPVSRTGEMAVAGQAESPAWIADIFVAAARIAKLYFKTKALSYDAPRRPDHDDEAFLGCDSLSWQALKAAYLDPCVDIVEILRGQVDVIADALAPGGTGPRTSVQHVRATVNALLDHVNRRVNPGLGGEVRVGVADLQSLAEFAWFCLTSITQPRVYPGWSDLLLDLSNYDSPLAGRVGTPLFETMTQAQSFIKGRYEQITHDRFNEIMGVSHYPPAVETRIHPAVASLLIAEHGYRAATREVARPPLPCAFVTSFDLELELALLKLGVQFVVALPVHLLNTVHDVAHTCWIAFRVPAADHSDRDRLTGLMQPGDDSWCVLDDNCPTDGPIVIRLAGCPLIKLPDLQGASDICEQLNRLFEEALMEDAMGDVDVLNDVMRNLKLQPAVVINEHDAMLQNTIDLIAISGSVTPGGQGRRYGLPIQLAGGTRKWSRFWMMLGVQIGDSAFRHRIATLVSAIPLTAAIRPRYGMAQLGGEAAELPDEVAGRNGLAVNLHATELEQDLLFWNGFEVITADVAEFSEDLRHYAGHLVKSARFNKGGECNV
jgi:hypothetical protein